MITRLCELGWDRDPRGEFRPELENPSARSTSAYTGDGQGTSKYRKMTAEMTVDDEKHARELRSTTNQLQYNSNTIWTIIDKNTVFCIQFWLYWLIHLYQFHSILFYRVFNQNAIFCMNFGVDYAA